MMIEIKFPAERKDIALAFAAALSQLGGVPVTSVTPKTEVFHDETVTIHTLPVVQPEAETVVEEPVGTATSERVDMKGVRFDADYCANAQEPFYSSGAQKGQWKARRGLAEGVYEKWYAGQLSASPAPSATEDEDTTPPVPTASAFSAASVPAATVGPQTGPDYMVWVSGKQAAGLLTQQAIDAAWHKLGLNVGSIFPPNPPEAIARSVGALYAELSAVAGA